MVKLTEGEGSPETGGCLMVACNIYAKGPTMQALYRRDRSGRWFVLLDDTGKADPRCAEFDWARVTFCGVLRKYPTLAEARDAKRRLS